MFQREATHVALVYEEHRGLLFRGDGRGVRAVVEDGKLGDGRARPLDVNYLLAPVEAFTEGPHRAHDDTEEAARLFACDEKNLVARVAALDGALGQRAQSLVVQLAEERCAFEGRDFVCRHRDYLRLNRHSIQVQGVSRLRVT